MTCLDVVMIVAELCRKRHNKVTKKMLKTPLEYARTLKKSLCRTPV